MLEEMRSAFFGTGGLVSAWKEESSDDSGGSTRMSLLLMLMFVFQDKWNYICYKVEN
jgi:hypothetical protein